MRKLRDPNDVMDTVFEWCFRNHPNGRKKALPIYRRRKQLFMYGIFGLGTYIISIGSYALFTEAWNWDILVANVLSWIFATAFAFYTNRKWVFVNHQKGMFAFVRQLSGFGGGRLITLVIEEWMLFFFVWQLDLPNMIVKFFSQIIVVALNYVFSKLIVFKKKEMDKREIEDWGEEK